MIWLGLNFALFAVQSALLLAKLSGLDAITFLRPALAMCVGPAIFLYARALDDKTPRAMDLAHLAPFVLVLSLIATGFQMWLIDPLIISSFAAYLFASVWLTLRLYKRNSVSPVVILWLVSLCCLMLINLLLELGTWFEVTRLRAFRDSRALVIGSIYSTTVYAFVLFGVLRRSYIFDWLHTVPASEPSEQDSKASPEQLALLERFESLIDSEQLHLREFGVTIAELARKLKVPKSELSQAINRCLGLSFSQYLNNKRIDLAKRLLLESDQAIVDVMLESGFSSKSHFNKEFQRVTGVSPSEFRKTS